MRMRKKKWAQPELDACPYFIADCDRYRGQWRTLFPKAQPLHVELGCGKGVSTAAMAHAERDTNFVAIDLISDVLGSARRNISAAYGAESVDNIRIASKNILFIHQTFAPEDRVEKIIISFCNPWAEREKHKKRRLTHPRQLMQYRAFLIDGGEIWFKTDDDDLFYDSIEYFRMCGFTMRYITFDLHASGFQPNYVSEHEALFSRQGVPIKMLIAVKGRLDKAPDLRLREDRDDD